VCAPGTATFSKISVRPKKRFWRGPAKTLPYQVTAQPDGAAPVTADGAIVQEAIVPRWLPAALLALAALALVLGVLWATLLKPAVQDAAKDEANKSLAALQTAAKQATKKADQAAQSANAAKQAATTKGGGSSGGAAPAPPSPPTTTTTTTVAPTLASLIAQGDGVTFRLVAPPPGVAPNTTVVVPYNQPAGQTFLLTDMVLENPQGDTGTVTIRRGGTAAGTLFQVALNNFRDLDYHFVAPVTVRPDAASQLQMVIQCATPGSPATACNPAVTFSGVLGKVP
jgi:hypothetical protein